GRVLPALTQPGSPLVLRKRLCAHASCVPLRKASASQRTKIWHARDNGVAPSETPMRYLVTARVKPGKEADLLRAIESGTLGNGSVAGDEYLRNMQDARLLDDGKAKWVEICFCDVPLAEE